MIRALLLIALALSAFVAAETVVTLTDATLHDSVKQNEFVLVEFYAPWCGHCKSLAPEYEKAATQLKEGGSKVILAKVDATAETKVAQEFGVQGFPTLKWFVNGKASDYGGGRTSDTIVSWVKKKSGPPTSPVTSAADVEKMKSEGEVVVILAATEESKAFTASAQEHEIPFGVALNPDAETLKALGLEKAGSIVVFKNFDEKRAEMAAGSDTTAEAISKFVGGHMLPLIVPFSQETAQRIFGGAVKQHVLVFWDKSDEATVTSVSDSLRPVAEENRGTYLFVSVDKSDERVTEFFGVTGKDIPTARVVQLEEAGMKKFKLVGDKLSAESMRETLKKHAAGELSQDLKSEEVPASDDGPVKTLVGKNFDQVVGEDGKIVFVEFYAPWCGHCKSLAPKWEELAKWAADKPSVVVAKMDSTANEIAQVQISGFPTLKLFKDKGETIVDYDGARELDEMKAFIDKHAA